jgi:hypothetical protein
MFTSGSMRKVFMSSTRRPSNRCWPDRRFPDRPDGREFIHREFNSCSRREATIEEQPRVFRTKRCNARGGSRSGQEG